MRRWLVLLVYIGLQHVLLLHCIDANALTVPDFRGLSKDSVRSIAAEKYIKVIITAKDTSKGYKAGVIKSQIPVPGEELKGKEWVKLTVSTGKPGTKKCVLCKDDISFNAKYCGLCSETQPDNPPEYIAAMSETLFVPTVVSKGFKNVILYASGGFVIFIIVIILVSISKKRGKRKEKKEIKKEEKMKVEKPKPRTPMEEIEELIKRGKTDTAIERLQKIRKIPEHKVKAAVLLADIEEKKGLQELGISFLKDALQDEKPTKENVEAFYKLARLYEETGEKDEAKKIYLEILSKLISYQDVEERYKQIKTPTPKPAPSVKASRTVTHMPELGKKITERYKIIDVRGEGGMGTIYEAEDTLLGRKVALKVMKKEIGIRRRDRERFLSEARIAAKLKHPNIVTLHNIEEEGGLIYLIFELIEGENLAELIDKEGSIELKRSLAIIEQSCDALSYAHSEGVIHRDVKSSNIMLDKHRNAKILDFGIARVALDTFYTLTGQTSGTPAYMAPEQHIGEKVDASSDLYGLGVTLYEMLTGELPFSGSDVLQLKREEKFKSVSSIIESVSQDVDKIIEKCIRFNRKERYRSAEELKKEIKQLFKECYGVH